MSCRGEPVAKPTLATARVERRADAFAPFLFRLPLPSPVARLADDVVDRRLAFAGGAIHGADAPGHETGAAQSPLLPIARALLASGVVPLAYGARWRFPIVFASSVGAKAVRHISLNFGNLRSRGRRCHTRRRQSVRCQWLPSLNCISAPLIDTVDKLLRVELSPLS